MPPALNTGVSWAGKFGDHRPLVVNAISLSLSLHLPPTNVLVCPPFLAWLSLMHYPGPAYRLVST